MILTNESDEILAELVKNGNQEAFAVLVDRYLDKIKRYGKRFVYEKSNLDDLVQDVFIKVYVNIQAFSAGRKFSPWIYRIAHNEFLNAIRKKSYENLISLDFDAFFPQIIAKDNQAEDFDLNLSRDLIEKCLADMDPKYREVMVLYFFEEMDYKMISDILTIPVSTVGVRLKRAKGILKKLLANKKI